jgi:STE24 endopeptidase
MQETTMTFDAQEATRQYIDSLGVEALAKAAAYTSGSEWLLLWGLAVSALVAWVFVRWGVLGRIAARLQQRGRALRTFALCACYLLLASLISLPWDLYTGWWRERSYGRTSQPLGDYLGQGAVALLISALLGGLFFLGVYALMRRAGRGWWIWSGGLAAAAIAALLLVSPVLIEPLFNKYQPVPEGPVREALVQMAHDLGIPPERIFMFDGSRQSNNFTANVSGLGSAARIAISDVALKSASLDEVRAVTGHEIGHYVLGHVWRMVLVMALLAMACFFLVDRLFPSVARWLGATQGIGDPAGLPVLMLVVSALMLLASPVTNGLIRSQESAADAFSLRTVNLPDALATALVKTAEYRDPRPNAVEEWAFYNHPSVERRVRVAMDWKAAHPAP